MITQPYPPPRLSQNAAACATCVLALSGQLHGLFPHFSHDRLLSSTLGAWGVDWLEDVLQSGFGDLALAQDATAKEPTTRSSTSTVTMVQW